MDKQPGWTSLCESLEYTNPNTSELVKTGSLITIDTINENNLIRDAVFRPSIISYIEK